MRYHIRWCIRRDIPEVVAMEELVHGVDGWTEEQILCLLRDRNVISMVAVQDETVVGYMIYELHKTELVLVRLVVHPDHPAAFLQLVGKLVSKLSTHRRTRISICVPDTEFNLHQAFKFVGWVATRVIWGGPGEPDQYVFEFNLDPAIVEQETGVGG